MLNILIVDDEPMARILLGSLLAPFGNCRFAENGEEAVRMVGEALDEDGLGYDLILMDIMMPGMDGLEATRRIAEAQVERGLDKEEHSKVIMASCLDDTKHLIAAQYDYDADYYIPKPIDFDALHEALINLELIAIPFNLDT